MSINLETHTLEYKFRDTYLGNGEKKQMENDSVGKVDTYSSNTD